MEKINVYADFDFLASPQEIGVLGYEQVRGNDHFVFEYSREWLKAHAGIVLSGDLLNVPSLQHPRGTNNVFGFVKDSFPDRLSYLQIIFPQFNSFIGRINCDFMEEICGKPQINSIKQAILLGRCFRRPIFGER